MDITEAFKFCPRCGHDLTSDASKLDCAHCRLTYYLNGKPTAALALRNAAGHYLLVQRGIEPGKGRWDLPGGFVERDESFEQAAGREAMEELGVEVEDLTYVTSAHDLYEYQEVVYDTLAVVFSGRIKGGGEPEPADDVAECRWLAPADFPTGEALAFPSLAAVLVRLVETAG